MQTPFFIIGTERSGTNLLRVILNSHSKIAIPHPPHIFKNLYPILKTYGNLNNNYNLEKLIKDVITLIKLHPYPWDISLNYSNIFDHIEEKSLIAILFYIYNQYKIKHHKKIFGCKSTFMINYSDNILSFNPSAKFIYLVRDGRDVAISAKSSIFNNYSVYYTAKLWKKEQHIGISLLEKLPKNQIFLLTYEELIQNLKKNIQLLCDFLEIKFEPNILNYYETKSAQKSNLICTSWENTAKPILANNFQKYLYQMKVSDIALFDAIAQAELKYFGYKVYNYKKNYKFKLRYLAEELFLLLKTQLKSIFKDKNNLLRYKKFVFVKTRRFVNKWIIKQNT